MFCCDFCEILKNTFSKEHLRATVSLYGNKSHDKNLNISRTKRMFNMKQKKIIYHFERAFIEANETNFFGRWEPSLMGCFSNLSKLSMFLQ